jgi:hypothetical protein
MRRTLTIDALALIDVIIERFLDPRFNSRITRYFELQYSYILAVLPKNIIALLPAEDQFFIDLFYNVLLPGARKKVCLSGSRFEWISQVLVLQGSPYQG